MSGDIGGLKWDEYMGQTGGAIQAFVLRILNIRLDLVGKSTNITSLLDWEKLVDLSVLKDDPAGESVVVGKRTFNPTIWLDGSKGDIIRFTFVSFDFSGLDKHEISVTGLRHSLTDVEIIGPAP